MHACSSVLPMRCSKHAFQARCSNLHQSIKKLSHRSDYSHGLNRFNPVSSKAAVLKANASTRDAEVIVVGAGIAGLSAALHLKKKGVKDILVIESGEAVGGRVKTDRVDGFLLDQGFQIFLTGYPEAQAALDYKALDLKPFYAGAKVWLNGSFHQVADPFRHPVDGILSLTNPIGTVFDKILVGLIRFRCLLGSVDDMMVRSESSIAERLKQEGFTDSMAKRFFRPFLGGIFFDRELGTSSRLLEFVLRTLASGSNCLPVGGIGAVPEQLAAAVQPEAQIQLGAHVSSVTGCSPSGECPYVLLADGSTIRAKRGVIVATNGPEAKRLLSGVMQAAPSKDASGVGTCCLYFKAPKPPSPQPMLYLNGEDNGIVNNCCFPSTVSPSYAPVGQTLVSVSTVGTHDELSDVQLEAEAKKQLGGWFGQDQVQSWSLLKIYRIPFAQPNQAPPTNFSRSVSLGSSLYVCGDHRDSATLDGALKSGRRAAEAVLSAA
ncbi:hypothetical protein CEUSTIGMA_g4275.t1 [Chlamydomonas eustigma]|uniref:Amine oxidase domain-containing protein n=1 Tax=Chlamydomonas eustigma TaxID=1157962 RepID=A0A250X1L6_9CHLO|nr:hypothetical protein CEUSTIGMA_g4275.t1 [Chlamydomonas eustigma]|eukprot:GAX76829.1 hypothetical protein CEUSTIGMA_g4275.t1 [Chlamydomonas eustigma]